MHYISFKPYYKWNTFNTIRIIKAILTAIVLNLIINGIPSIPFNADIILFLTLSF